VKREIQELTCQGALEAIGAWRERGCEFVSIVDGVPRPWPRKPIEVIFAEAEQRGVEVLSLTNNDHVKSILAAISNYVERSLRASRAEVRRPQAVVARRGSF
jgi:hypothetical protein